jgi:hypothetical protein
MTQSRQESRRNAHPTWTHRYAARCGTIHARCCADARQVEDTTPRHAQARQRDEASHRRHTLAWVSRPYTARSVESPEKHRVPTSSVGTLITASDDAVAKSHRRMDGGGPASAVTRSEPSPLRHSWHVHVTNVTRTGPPEYADARAHHESMTCMKRWHHVSQPWVEL